MKPVTILIPTYNRARTLEAVWPSYADNPLVDKIVIVNDGSTDNTSELVRRLSEASATKIQVVEHVKKKGQQASRRAAIDAAESDWVLFGEDDVYLAVGYVETLLQQAGSLQADIIAGRCVTTRVPGEFDSTLIVDLKPKTDENEVFDFSTFEMNTSAVIPEPIIAPYMHSIALIRRAVFRKVGFDPWYRGNAHREETDFYLSAGKLGMKLYFTPDASCYHLRGPICAAGGQRINRLSVEYWNIINSCHLVKKHWVYLQTELGFRGTPSAWLLRYVWRRESSQARRLIKTGGRSSFRP
jgi:glycosyltransferase involved in cell wall biosynthesis